MSTREQERTQQEGIAFLLVDGHALARSILHNVFCWWAIATFAYLLLVLLSGNAWGQGHHRRRHRERHPATQVVAQGQTAVAQRVQPTVQPSGCTGSDAIAARDARTTGVAAIERSDWETCASAYTISLSIANGACARPEARQNLAICLDASGRSAQALEQLELLQRSGELPPGTDGGALQTRIDTIRRRIQQAQSARPPVASALVCQGVQRACGGACVNVQTDPRNCGGCGGTCPAGNVCTAGSCRIVFTTEPPNTGFARRTASLGLMVGGGVALVAGISFITLGAINTAKADEDAQRLATDGCHVMGTSPTCLLYPAGSSRPDELAAWQTPLGGVLTGVGAVSLGVGIVLHLTSRSPPPIRPTAGLGSLGLEFNF